MIASLSAAIGHDVPDAVQEAMERAETERMRRNELESFVAQNYFVQKHLPCPQRVAYVCHMQRNTRTISFSLLTCVRFSSQKLDCFQGRSVRS